MLTVVDVVPGLLVRIVPASRNMLIISFHSVGDGYTKRVKTSDGCFECQKKWGQGYVCWTTESARAIGITPIPLPLVFTGVSPVGLAEYKSR